MAQRGVSVTTPVAGVTAIDTMLSARAWRPVKTVKATSADETSVLRFICFFFRLTCLRTELMSADSHRSRAGSGTDGVNVFRSRHHHTGPPPRPLWGLTRWGVDRTCRRARCRSGCGGSAAARSAGGNAPANGPKHRRRIQAAAAMLGVRGMRTSIFVPARKPDLIVRAPPTAEARSRMLSSPRPPFPFRLAESKPIPSSLIVN